MSFQGSAKITMKALLIIPAFLVVMAWRYRANRPVFFVVVASIFAVAALLVSVSNLPERILESLALAWATCMLVAGAFAGCELVNYLRKKNNAMAPHDPKTHDSQMSSTSHSLNAGPRGVLRRPIDLLTPPR
jgi:putative Ca2+/H+ antiporter (TMEM165/GDT1 family)